MKYLKYIFIIIIIILAYRCEKNNINESEFDVNNNIEKLLFNVSKEIIIPEYIYEDEDGYQYKINGTKDPYKIDTVNKRPKIKWDTIDSPLTIVTISTDSLIVKSNRIINIEAIIWLWHNGLKNGKNGNISFYNGCNVINGKIQYTEAPIDLEKGKLYFLNIWAFDYFGKKIKYSSKQKKIFVIR